MDEDDYHQRYEIFFFFFYPFRSKKIIKRGGRNLSALMGCGASTSKGSASNRAVPDANSGKGDWQKVLNLERHQLSQLSFAQPFQLFALLLILLICGKQGVIHPTQF